MEPVATTTQVVDEPARNRLVVRSESGDEAELVYDRDDDSLYLLHTLVPPALSGQGIGSALVRAAIELARSQGRVVVPWCPFARGWLHHHDAEAEGAVIDWVTRPPVRH